MNKLTPGAVRTVALLLERLAMLRLVLGMPGHRPQLGLAMRKAALESILARASALIRVTHLCFVQIIRRCSAFRTSATRAALVASAGTWTTLVARLMARSFASVSSTRTTRARTTINTHVFQSQKKTKTTGLNFRKKPKFSDPARSLEFKPLKL